jgi:hypothetical protein
MVAVAAPFASEMAVFAVVAKLSKGGNGFGLAADESVDKVEMMGRLGQQQTAALIHIGVPPAIVAGAMSVVTAGIVLCQQPFKMDVVYFSQNSGIYQIFHLHDVAHIAHIEADADFSVIPIFCLQNFPALLGIDAHGFFTENLTSGVQRPDNELGMGIVRGGDDDTVRLGGVQHFVKIFIGGGMQLLGHILRPAKIDIIHSHQLTNLGDFLPLVRNFSIAEIIPKFMVIGVGNHRFSVGIQPPVGSAGDDVTFFHILSLLSMEFGGEIVYNNISFFLRFVNPERKNLYLFPEKSRLPSPGGV